MDGRSVVLATLIAAVLAAATYGLYMWYESTRVAIPPPRVEAPAAPAPPVAPAAPAEPAIAHPLPGEPPEAAMQAPAVPPAEAMAAFERDASALADPAAIGRYFLDLASLVRRLVSSVDNVASDELPLRARAVAPMRGAFAVSGRGESMVIDPANAKRYEPFVAFVESIDTRRAVEVYIRHYRLFQGEYRGQGSPNRYFNDRVVGAIDHLLATPQVDGPIRLVQPKVLYRYADPQLEALSASQKAMIRMGPQNAARIKAKLRALRAEIARQGAPQAATK